jgi:tetratricopeptide (TPR) repeat protein
VVASLAQETVERGIDVWLDLSERDDEGTDAAFDLLLSWLEGRRLTNRADEPEQRVAAAEDLVDLFGERVPWVHRYHAQAVLALPAGHEDRDVPWAVGTLGEQLDQARANDDADNAVRTIAALLLADVGDDALLDEGETWAQAADGDGAQTFTLAADAFCSTRHIIARDAGDAEQAEHWAERQARYVPDEGEEGLGALAGRAARHDMLGEWDEAAAAYHTIVESSDLSAADVQQLALREGQLRLALDEYDRAVEVLDTLLPHAEARYLTSVTDDDVYDAQERLDSVADALAAALARQDDWDGVLRALDRAGGLRGRYRAALRADPVGRDMLALERRLDAAARGAPVDGAIPARAQLLERYRQVRPQLGAERLASPSIAEVGAALEAGEAVAAIGLHFTGTVGIVIAPGDVGQPAGRVLLEDVETLQWLELFAGENDGDGDWLPALHQPGSGLKPEPSLSRVLAGVDELIGRWLRRQLDELGLRRLTLVPDTMLHLIPWPALPSLRGIDVVMAASVSEVVRGRRAVAAPARREALVVANPTLDLRVSAAACGPVAQQLADAGFAVTEVAGAEATEAALLGAVSGRSVLHYAGHGRAERMRSGLELQPDPALTGDGDPFAAWVEQAGDWRDPPANEDDDDEEEEPPWVERFADVPGVGRLAERRWTHGDRLERRLEHAGGTLVADYAGDQLVRLAELLSASDLMLAEGLDGCRLAVLVACASGAGVGRKDEARAGVPIALQLAGIDSVVGTHWEVEEGFAALWAESFYAGLLSGGAHVDLAALVRRTGDELREMSAAVARERLLALTDLASDPFAAMELEAYAHHLPDPPFAAPAQWAAFYVIGRPTIDFEEAGG